MCVFVKVNKQRRRLLMFGGCLPVSWLLSSCGGGGGSQLNDNPPIVSLPIIVTHPVSQTVMVGKVVVFSVLATGDSLVYQWQQNGINLLGATDSVFTTLPVTQGDDDADYRVIVANAAGSILSNQAILTVRQQNVNVDSLGITVDSVTITVDGI